MATIRKLPNGKWQAQVFKRGVRKSASFNFKNQAIQWSNQFEQEIANNNITKKKGTVADLLREYAHRVSIHKKGVRWEQYRIEKICRSFLGSVTLEDLSADDIARYRDDLFKSGLKSSSVNRELTLITSAFNIAVDEWGWLSTNPAKRVRKPKEPAARNRRVYDKEIEALCFVAGLDDECEAVNMSQRTILCFLVAIETGMRAGEILGLTWQDVDLENQVARLHTTKNGLSRDVSLSTKAVTLFKRLPKFADWPTCFNLEPGLRDALFRKIRDKAGIENLHFHDSRHEAVTRMSKKLSPLELARTIGHRNLNQLLTYYEEDARSIAKRLD